MVFEAARKVREKTGLNRVVLSDSAWHNRYLSVSCRRTLQDDGFAVLYHHQVPPGDGGLALGQALVAAATAER